MPSDTCVKCPYGIFTAEKRRTGCAKALSFDSFAASMSFCGLRWAKAKAEQEVRAPPYGLQVPIHIVGQQMLSILSIWKLAQHAQD